jgi:energy-coupling factor transporter ATP-binding protein EcfA2
LGAARHKGRILGSLFDKRFVIVAGKGGVGKSTMSAALALVAARAGKRVLIAELGSKERAARLLGHDDDVGYSVTKVLENIEVINVQPAPAMHEYGLMKLKFEKVYAAVFENPVMRSLTRMIPGMNELVLIGKAWHLEREKNDDGTPRWDTIIVDAPATGHGISLLVLPHVVSEVVKRGPLADETREIRDMLIDPERTIMNIVTLPEEMPVSETLHLEARMGDTLQIQPGYIFINGVWPLPVPDLSMDALKQLGTQPGLESAADAALKTNRFMTRRAVVQQAQIARLKGASQLPKIQIPYQFTEGFGFDAVDAISRHVETAMLAQVAEVQ